MEGQDRGRGHLPDGCGGGGRVGGLEGTEVEHGLQ